MSVGQFGTGQSTRPVRLLWAPLTLSIFRGLSSGGFQGIRKPLWTLSGWWDPPILPSPPRGGIPAADLKAGERSLLKEAREWMMRLPFSPIDILIVAEMGKNVSGSGMDTKVIRGPTNPFEPLK